MDKSLPPIPDKRYFTIGEVSALCLVKPYVLRYWEQEFLQLKPMKRRGNRRYYQHHELLLIRRIRGLLYDEGFTIIGARNRLADTAAGLPGTAGAEPVEVGGLVAADEQAAGWQPAAPSPLTPAANAAAAALHLGSSVARVGLLNPALPASNAIITDARRLREELLSIRELLEV